MPQDKRPKWDINATVEAATKASKLAETYRPNLENRLQPDDLETLKAGGEELSLRHSGQSENLTLQMSKTLGQEEAIRLINSRVVSIHNIVKNAATTTNEINKAFGVGVRIMKTVDSVKAAANIVVTAYTGRTEWSNKAGIIDADITELNNLLSNLSQAKDTKSSSMIVRKLRTMDKTILHRTVEDLVSKISSLGEHAFGIENPALAKLFSELIPSATNGKTDAKATTPTVAANNTNA